MAWFKKKPDPLSDRARSLNEQIATLEAEIKRLDTQLQRGVLPPRNQGADSAASAGLEATPPPDGSHPRPDDAPEAPIFEKVDQHPLRTRPEQGTTPEHFNDLGVRKYDLPALVQRVRNHFRGPATTNPKLVSYLAAGGIQGLRPMRYEKRVARNRFIALVIILFLILLGIVAVFVRNY